VLLPASFEMKFFTVSDLRRLIVVIDFLWTVENPAKVVLKRPSALTVRHCSSDHFRRVIQSARPAEDPR
jgi:hypothetical protein